MRWLRWTLSVVVACAVLALALAWWALRSSLPQLDGELPAPGLTATATIVRDSRGVPTIVGATRTDLAYATGFAHGQDRFFQMDLARRLAAGELAELFGGAAVPLDKRTRRFAWRAVAKRVVESATPAERAVLEAYARGVNAGVASLGAKPFEYSLVSAPLREWVPEDSALVVHSMWWQLQWGVVAAEFERLRIQRAAAAKYDAEAAGILIRFLYPGHTTWETPNYAADSACAQNACTNAMDSSVYPVPGFLEFAPPGARAGPGERTAPGSNSWAVAGVHTANGAALIANDMHLDTSVPAVWYHARLRVSGEGGDAMDVTGVTLPGTPAVAAGSNGHVAWGFTNSYGDFSDLRWTRCDRADFTTRRESIAVKGAAPVAVEYRDSAFSVVLDGDEYAAAVAPGECIEVAWLAMRHEATNFALLGLERARSVEAALALAPLVGVPGQNMVVGDSAGRIAWTLLGRVPRESGPDRLFGPLTFRDAADHPRLADPPVGRLWTANQRILESGAAGAIDDDEAAVGAGGYDVGARARQIRDDLLGLAHLAKPADMLKVQLDDRAVFMGQWQRALLETLDDAAVAGNPKRAEFRRLVQNWEGRAEPGSVAYRLVRTWRSRVIDALWRGATTPLVGAEFTGRPPSQFEFTAWQLLNGAAAATTPPMGKDWREFRLERVDAAIEFLATDCPTLAACTYGSRRPVRIQHPLSRAVPALARFLDMPTRELAGDNHMPRVQDGNFGASERMGVSPGHEAEGYLQLPGGPSGHPLSSFYASGFNDWAEGRPTPFLPGPAAHRLDLTP